MLAQETKVATNLQETHQEMRNPNVTFIYDNIVHVLQNEKFSGILQKKIHHRTYVFVANLQSRIVYTNGKVIVKINDSVFLKHSVVLQPYKHSTLPTTGSSLRLVASFLISSLARSFFFNISVFCTRTSSNCLHARYVEYSLSTRRRNKLFNLHWLKWPGMRRN